MTPDELRAAMQRLGMNADQLAVLLQVKGGRSTVHKWLRGERAISGPVARLIEKELKEEAEELS